MNQTEAKIEKLSITVAKLEERIQINNMMTGGNFFVNCLALTLILKHLGGW